MNTETKNCQSCKKDFIIESEDFAFYTRIKVPPPTFCPWCRFLRRNSWRNERTLYKRTCDLCKKNMVAMHPADAPFPVYCRECWYSDNWDPISYGRDYDFSRPFFSQLRDLFDSVPRIGLWQRNAVNSDYSNMTAESKNVYLSCSVVVGCENVFYSKSIDRSSNIFDSRNVADSDGCYEDVEGTKNYNTQHTLLSRNCINSFFLYDCVNSSNCALSSNLRNKEYVFRNRQCSKEEYQAELAKLNLGSRKGREQAVREFEELKRSAITRFANTVGTHDSTGNNIANSRNLTRGFDAYEIENGKYVYRAFKLKDVMDFDFGADSELMYEYDTGAKDSKNVRFSFSTFNSMQDAEYVLFCAFGSNLFGCSGLRKKDYCILNKQYSKEEFHALRERIVKHMDEMPYADKGGRVHRYGEFFPMEISPFAYNETPAQEFEPLTKEEALAKGYVWRDMEAKNPPISIPAEDIPDSIGEVDEGILKQTLGCAHGGDCAHQCTKAFLITPDELRFYKKNSIALPDKCPNCRYYERLNKMPPPKLWSRQCMCDYEVRGNGGVHAHHAEGRCPNTFETPYAEDEKKILYCEECYNAEVN